MASIHTALPVSQFSALAARPAKPLCYAPASRITCSAAGAVAEPKLVGAAEPLLLSAVRGDDVERPPVWLMRQAGRYMKSYQTLCEKHPSFRERSENVDLVVEISLQPWKVFKPDGVILFSDILTPLSGMNIPFDIVKGKGPIIFNPLRTAADVEQVVEFVPEEFVPYVGEALTILRKEVNNEAAVLGFVGAPFTLASYVVEGGSSKHFSKIKRLAFSEPKVLHALLQKFTTSLVRLHFHDCFVNGCDGSILLDDTSSFTGEKNAFPNANSARGFDVVDTIKAAVEMVCLGIVSCADLLAIAARDSVVSLGGPNWNVKLGRRDARTTSQAAAARSIPPPTSSLNSLILRFAIVGLSSRDMVALSGSHTFGQARCATFRNRIYNETTIDPTFAQERQQNCPRATGTGDNNLAPFVGRILVKRLIPADCMRVILSAVRQFLSRLRDVCDEA